MKKNQVEYVEEELEIPFSKEQQQQNERGENEISFLQVEVQKRKKSGRATAASGQEQNHKNMRKNTNNNKQKQQKVKMQDEELKEADLGVEKNKKFGELIDRCIDIIRHQQYLLDNMDHLDSYNEFLLGVWKVQLNLLDTYDRFAFYKQLGRMKSLFRRMKFLIDGGCGLFDFDQKNNNKAVIEQISKLRDVLIEDCRSRTREKNKGEELKVEIYYIQCRLEKGHKINFEELDLLKRSVYYVDQLGWEGIIGRIFLFVMKLISMERNQADEQKIGLLRCDLCQVCEFQEIEYVIRHIFKAHLNFFSCLLMGSNDKCFELVCNSRKGNNFIESYRLEDHLKCTHSEIYQADRIFTKLYGGRQGGGGKAKEEYFENYSNDKHWKQKFTSELLNWLDEVNPGSDQYLKDSGMLQKKGEIGLKVIRDWIESDDELLQSEVRTSYQSFDQLSFLLKLSWCRQGGFESEEEETEQQMGGQNSGGQKQKNEAEEWKWILEKLRPEPCRIHLIEVMAGLLDTKKSLINQFHRYLYLGVFNFKCTHAELPGRLQTLEKWIKQLGVFQAVVFNSEVFVHDKCYFEGVMCDLEKSGKFSSPLIMLQHYYDYHLGVFQALSDGKLKENLGVEFNSGRINSIQFNKLRLSELIHFLHDYYQADYKTRSKKYLRECRRNFQLKCVCCNCGKELQEFGQVYWKDVQLLKRKENVLKFKHQCKVEELIRIYKYQQGGKADQQLEGNCQYSEFQVLKDQCHIYKMKIFEEMKREILIDDGGRLSQCKSCNKKQKGFHPLLKELKAEYFRLPGADVLYNFKHEVQLEKEADKQKLEIRADDPKFIKIQKGILNRAVEEKAGGSWQTLQEQMQSGYWKLDSFPKLVEIYGDISESCDQNSRRVLSQPILSGYMKVLFQTPLLYIPNTSIIYEMQPQWAKLRHKFKLFGSSDLQRAEMIQLLESHPVMQNHTYQLTRLTQLCVDQVDLQFKLNKHLMKQKNLMDARISSGGQNMNESKQKKGEEEELKLRIELNKTADLLYFEGVLHRAQVYFVVQQFKIWQEVFTTAELQVGEFVEQEKLKWAENRLSYYTLEFLERADREFSQFISIIDSKWKNLILMLVLCVFYCESGIYQMKLPYIEHDRLSLGGRWEFLDFIFEKAEQNPLRFIFESHLLPILTPLLSQFIHPIFLGTLLQLFQLDFEQKKEAEEEQGGQQQQQQYYGNEDSFKYYLDWTYHQLSKLTIKRCIPLFDEKRLNGFKRPKRRFMKVEQSEDQADKVDQADQTDQAVSQKRKILEIPKKEEQQQQEREEKEDEDAVLTQRRRKLENERRFFQLEMFYLLNETEIVDMQCRYVLAKRSLIKILNSGREDPPIECDLRWAMQIGQMFFSSLKKRSSHGQDEEQRVARENVKQLKELKEEADHYFHSHKPWIPEDFLFKQFKVKNGEQITSDLRAVLEEILADDQKSQINQVFNRNQYKFINKLKIGFFIPMEKKLQDVLACVAKLRSLPHRQSSRSMEKFHRYNFRELELLAFPELFATGQGFQQHMAPQIERSSIILEMSNKDRESAQDILRNLKTFKKELQNEVSWADNNNNQEQQKSKNNTFQIQAILADFTSQYRQGKILPKPKKAILQLQKEEFIRAELTSAYIYDLQKISVIKVFQEAIESQGVEEKTFQLEQNIEINLRGNGEVLSESLKNDHILKNFRQLLKKQQNWSNECQSFIRRITNDVREKDQFVNLSSSGELNSNILDYIRLQEEVFLENKRKEFAVQFQNMDLSELDCLRKQHTIDLKRTKIKKSKKGKKINNNTIQEVSEEIHSEIMSSILPLDGLADQIQKQLGTYSTQYTTIGEDTKFRLINKNTRIFNYRYSFIFWRFTQRMIQRIFSYYTMVNGINFYENQQGGQKSRNDKLEIKELQQLPPIKGSSVYFKQKYKEQRAICFQKNTPYFFLTYTFNEFKEKNFQLVQGLNNFDLENADALKFRRKKMDKRKYNSLQKQFTIYFHHLCKAVTKCIMQSEVTFKINSSLIPLYDWGMFGPCIGFTNRFEYQQRGTIHLHQLLYFRKDSGGQLPPKLLEFWAAIFSLWNYNRREKDKQLVQGHQLEHQCQADCILEERGDCRKGFPMKLNSRAYWKSGRINLIFPRVADEMESRILMHDRDIVKLFKSPCIVESCGSDKVVNYITKYLSKSGKKSTDEESGRIKDRSQKKEESTSDYDDDDENKVVKVQKIEEREKEEGGGGEEESEEKTEKSYKQQATDLVHKVLSKSVTSLAEALADLLGYPVFQTSFNVIKIAQVPLNEQFKLSLKNVKDNFDLDNPDSDLKTQIRSSIWIKYLSRPQELEILSLIEYVQHFVWYGKRTRYRKKLENQADKKMLFLIDKNGQIIKEREWAAFEVIINLSEVYYLEDKSYEPNLYYLTMLQLFWPHRQESWLRETNDSHDGFKQAYHRIYESDEGREFNILSGGQNYLEKFGLFRSFKEAVDNYKNLTPAQEEFLKSVQYKPKKRKLQSEKDEQNSRLCKQYLSYNVLMRAKNTIIKLGGLLEQEGETFKHAQDVSGILKFLRPDILINMEQKERVEEVENQLIQYISQFVGGWIQLPSAHQTILEELSSLMRSQNFHKLQSVIYRQTISNQKTPNNKSEKTLFNKLELSTESKISQREIELFSNFEDNIHFPQHFRTSLTRSEFKNLIRPKMSEELFENFDPPEEKLTELFKDKCNKQQRLAIIILLHYLYSSQITSAEGEIINEGCLIHGGGGVGKSFIIEFFIQLFEEIKQPLYILCPTQVAVQNIIKDRIEYSKSVMTIHSFFHLNPSADIDTSYDHFLAFLRFVKKDHFFKNSTASLYPDLAFYNCMNKVEKFTLKLQGVNCIILEEISMMPPKFLTLLDIYLQVSLSNNLTFGGLQIFAFGDSFQLQPVTNPPAYYFQSHVFQNNYFSTCLELGIPVRQQADLQFYENILQPIRLGRFQSHPLYRNSLRQLQMRHLDEKINPETSIALALGLQTQVQRLQVENDITFLYFDNQAVTKENQRRADQHIEYSQLRQQNFLQQSEQYRQFINLSARLSFGVKSFEQDLLLQNLSEDYDVQLENLESQVSSAQHFKLLPLSVRNFIYQKLLPLVYERTKWTQKKFAQSFPLHIKLFRNAEIIFRQNLIKELRVINGQAAVIKDLYFDVDFKSEEQRKVQVREKEKIIEEFLADGLIYQADKSDFYRIEFDKDFINAVKEELERDDVNNINCFFEGEVLESEKVGLLQAGIQPRLQGVSVQIQGSAQQIYLQNLTKYYQQVTVQMPSNQIKGVVREALYLIRKLRGRLTQSNNQSVENLKSVFENMLLSDKTLTHLLGLGVLTNNINSYYLIRAENHLQGLLEKLDDEWTPMVIAQLPINLGYARTIHTSQGATFDNVCVTLDGKHLSRPGLLYTAFSRVRSLQQLFLQGDFNEQLFNVVIPEELRQFYSQNFIQADEILHSKFFSALVDNQVNDFKEVLKSIKDKNKMIREKLLKQLPRRI